MELTVTFLIEILVVAVLLGVLLVSLLISLRRRSVRDEDASRARAEQSGKEAAREPLNRREFFKSTGLGKNQEIKLRLYSPDEYREELDGGNLPKGTLAAVKAYRRLEDEWLNLPPRQAADALELPPEDYAADEEREVLLLKRMPPGLPSSAVA